MAEDEGLSIEETNKLRASLGLKPLNLGPPKTTSASSDGPLTSEEQELRAANNLRDRREAESKDKKNKDVAERLRKARERAERDRRLKGSTLADDNDEDTMAWIRRTKENPAKSTPSAPMLTVAPSTSQYTTRDLEGLRVGHDSDDIEHGDEVVLTLRDSGVLDDDAPDELVNISLNEKAALKTRLDNKKRKSVYTTYEDDEVDEETGEKKILARYDDEVDAKPKKKGFAISTSGASSGSTDSKPLYKQQRILHSLDEVPESVPTSSDYAEPVKMKKPRKKKQIRKTRTSEREEDADETMAADSMQSNHSDTRTLTQHDNLVDDDDLQASLAKQRRLAVQRRIKMKADEIAESITATATDTTGAPSDSPGLVLDETTEFTRGLQDIKILPAKVKREVSSGAATPAAEDEVDIVMTDAQALVKQETAQPEISTMGIEEEATLDQGIGAAMAMLRQKGAIQEDEAQAKLRHAKEAWLTKDKRIRLEIEIERRRVREELRNSPRFRNMSVREREAYAASENKRLDAMEARATLDRFRDYKPNIEIKYVDDFGRNMNQKEAFKHMSHQFHGKDSGSGKTAKKLAQIEKEKLNEQKSLFK